MADGRRDNRNRAVAGIHLMLMWLTEVKTRPTYVRRIVRDVLAASVGFGLGVSYSRVGGMAPDLTNLPAEEQRTEQSKRGQLDHLDGRTVAVRRRPRRADVHWTGRRSLVFSL